MRTPLKRYICCLNQIASSESLSTICFNFVSHCTPTEISKKVTYLFQLRLVKGIFVTRDRPFFFPVKCEMVYFFPRES